MGSQKRRIQELEQALAVAYAKIEVYEKCLNALTSKEAKK